MGTQNGVIKGIETPMGEYEEIHLMREYNVNAPYSYCNNLIHEFRNNRGTLLLVKLKCL
jgi:hypothetical protein